MVAHIDALHQLFVMKRRDRQSRREPRACIFIAAVVARALVRWHLRCPCWLVMQRHYFRNSAWQPRLLGLELLCARNESDCVG